MAPSRTRRRGGNASTLNARGSNDKPRAHKRGNPGAPYRSSRPHQPDRVVFHPPRWYEVHHPPRGPPPPRGPHPPRRADPSHRVPPFPNRGPYNRDRDLTFPNRGYNGGRPRGRPAQRREDQNRRHRHHSPDGYRAQRLIPQSGPRDQRLRRGRRYGGRNRENVSTTDDHLAPLPSLPSRSSIHISWKKPLGALLRYYVHQRCLNPTMTPSLAEKEVERMYYQHCCDVNETKNALLRALDDSNEAMQSYADGWVRLDMVLDAAQFSAVEQARILRDFPGCARRSNTEHVDATGPSGNNRNDIRLFQLPVELGPGEGPAHQHETWRYVRVPQWAMGKAYHFVVSNRSPLSLSCAMTVDDENNEEEKENSRVKMENDRPGGVNYNRSALDDGPRRVLARNAPVPAHSSRAIRPDPHARYFDTPHEWILQSAVRTPLMASNTAKAEITDDQNATDMPAIKTDADAEMNESDAHLPQQAPIETAREPPTAAMPPKPANPSGTIYYGKNDAYDFTKAGHENRREALQKLQPTTAFQEWERAARREWSFVHAKFFVSLPRRRLYGGSGNRDRRNNRSRDLAPLPKPATIVDLKATERAVLATEFRPTGPRRNGSNNPCNVRMERIKGLSDEKEWAADPVFECKLYYRPIETVVKLDEDDEMSEDGEEAGEENQVNEELMEEEDVDSAPSLQELKNDKTIQLDQWHEDTMAIFRENDVPLPLAMRAEFDACRRKMQAASDEATADEVMREYMVWWNQQWAAASSKRWGQGL